MSQELLSRLITAISDIVGEDGGWYMKAEEIRAFAKATKCEVDLDQFISWFDE